MATQNSNLIVVGIGASAGGIEALKEFFSAMPSDSGLAFAVIQHLDPGRTSYMAEILGKWTRMRVIQAEDGMAVQPDCVYTIPPNKFLFVKEDTFHLAEPTKRDGLRMPIDFFFRALAENFGDKAVGVLLSGGGSDGTLGIREIHGGGGLVLVQEPATAQFDSMVMSALATGLVDSVLPVEKIPTALLDYSQHSNGQVAKDVGAETAAEDISAILGLLASHSKHGFHAYRKNTLLRRIRRRMGVNQINDVADYARMLRQNPEEVSRLARDLLIGVTSFFRDADAFEELRAQAIAPLVEQKQGSLPLRVWTAGCSTGEEAYSIAMVIREEMTRRNKSFPVQIFATDVVPDGLKFAREAIYPESIAADVSEERLARFFVKKNSSYQIIKEIREWVTFAAHNVLVDPPFLKMDLISCRNLLIYVEGEVQRRIHGLFAFALNPGGYLFLGKSEGINQDEIFQPVSRHFRIYRRLESAVAGSLYFPARPGIPPSGLQARLDRGQPRIRLAELNNEMLLKHFDAAIVLVDERGRCLHFYGPVTKYIELPAGDATLSLFDMIDRSHLPKFRLALEQAYRENGSVTLDKLESNRNNNMSAMKVTVSCCVESRSGTKLAAVIFEEVPRELGVVPAAVPGPESSPQAAYIEHLETENKSLKEELQANIEGFHASYEEFTSANEELITMNEELQSSNEELETAKEELQSVNEELVTVNSQINENMIELGHANDDLANFLNSSEVGTIFLDTHFCIRRFTPATQRLLNVLPLDVGRPVEHISNKFTEVNLTAVAEEVLKNLTPTEREVRSSDGFWYMMRCLPYRTLDNKIDGVVLTFTDVTRLKRSEALIEEARRFAQSIVDTVRESLLVLDGELRVVSASRGYYYAFKARPEDTEGRSVYELDGDLWHHVELRPLLERTLTTGEELNNLEVAFELPSTGRRTMLLNARVLPQPADRSRLILLEIEDCTDRRLAAEILAKSEEQQRHKADDLEQQLIASGRLVSLGEITASMAHEFNNPLGIIMGFVEDLRSEIEATDSRYQALTIIDEEARRCKRIIEDLMQFARPGDAQRRPTYIGPLIDTTLHMMDSRCYKQKVAMARRIQQNLPPLPGDPQQLEQVLINLYLNALDAMPDGGTLTVGAEVGNTDAGESIVITVVDTGMGMAEEELQKIFQPFYTAKKKAGLGLGLPICERIVKNHGGRIEVKSQPSKGTTFTIHLPTERTAKSAGPGG